VGVGTRTSARAQRRPAETAPHSQKNGNLPVYSGESGRHELLDLGQKLIKALSREGDRKNGMDSKRRPSPLQRLHHISLRASGQTQRATGDTMRTPTVKGNMEWEGRGKSLL